MASAPPGMTLGPNLNLFNRPRVPNPEVGGISTLYTTGYNVNGEEVNLPRVSTDGRFLTHDEAIAEYLRTGQHLGKFKDPDSAANFADLLHQHQAWQGGEEPAQGIRDILALYFGAPGENRTPE